MESLQLKPGEVIYKCPKCCCVKPERAHHCRHGSSALGGGPQYPPLQAQRLCPGGTLIPTTAGTAALPWGGTPIPTTAGTAALPWGGPNTHHCRHGGSALGGGEPQYPPLQARRLCPGGDPNTHHCRHGGSALGGTGPRAGRG